MPLIFFRCSVFIIPIIIITIIIIIIPVPSCCPVFMLSPAHAATTNSWGDVSDPKARESRWGSAVLDSVPEQTATRNVAESGREPCAAPAAR